MIEWPEADARKARTCSEKCLCSCLENRDRTSNKRREFISVIGSAAAGLDEATLPTYFVIIGLVGACGGAAAG